MLKLQVQEINNSIIELAIVIGMSLFCIFTFALADLLKKEGSGFLSIIALFNCSIIYFYFLYRSFESESTSKLSFKVYQVSTFVISFSYGLQAIYL